MALRILVCLDESTFSKAAMRVAVGLQHATGGDLTALHVVNVTSSSSGNLLQDLAGSLGFEPARVSPDVLAQHVASGEAVLAEVQALAAARGQTVETVVAHGTVRACIADAARLADLVVLGLRGNTEDEFPGQGGGHLDTSLADVDAPLLLCPRDCAEVTSFVLGYDGSVAASHALRAIRGLRDAGLEVPVLAVHVGASGEVLAEVSDALPPGTVSTRVVATEGRTVHDTLAEVAREQPGSVLAVGFRGRSRSRDFLVGTATEQLVTAGNVALLVAH
jgi:nucleotide-binding universal stress UspA family protein